MPGVAARAGSMTSAWKMRPASSMVASCSSSLEPKWAYTPLLLMSREPAR